MKLNPKVFAILILTVLADVIAVRIVIENALGLIIFLIMLDHCFFYL